MASGNAGKIKEIVRLLAHLNVEIVPQSDYAVSEADETGSTFEENAIIKARHAAAATGLPAIADDSGLAVDALNGRPGVHSARYSGANASDDDNIDHLLEELRGLPEQQRSAAFHCVACFLLTPDAEPLLASVAVLSSSLLCLGVMRTILSNVSRSHPRDILLWSAGGSKGRKNFQKKIKN